MILRTDAIVLRTYRMTETSKVAVFYTRARGKIKAVARGARSPKSRFGASLEPFTEGTYAFHHRIGRDLQVLGEGEILHPFEGVKADLDRLSHAGAIAELTDHLAVEEEPNPHLYGVLRSSLARLEELPGEESEIAFWSFEVGAAEALGYRPSFDHCSSCEKPWRRGKAGFSPGAGGLVCRDCGGGAGEPLTLGEETVNLLIRLQACDPEFPAGIPPDVRAEVRRALRLFVEYHTENRRPLRSLRFRDQVTLGTVP